MFLLQTSTSVKLPQDPVSALNGSNMTITSVARLFTVPYFSVRLQMLIVGLDGSLSWFLNLSETGESTKCPWVGVFVLSPVSLASRDQDGGPVELNDRHLRSHGKIGDCEQSSQ